MRENNVRVSIQMRFMVIVKKSALKCRKYVQFKEGKRERDKM